MLNLESPNQLDFSKTKQVRILDSNYVFILHLWNMQFFTTTSSGKDEITEHMKLLNLLSVGLACFCSVANVF